MRISLNWLNEYIPIKNIPVPELCKTLTDLGLEVESVEEVSTIKGDVVVGKIVASEKHPNAENLKFCRVDIGRGGEPLEIVCGAPNANVGVVACVATIGSTLPGDLKIKKSKIRGVESHGMMLAEDELGISDNHATIIELHPSTVLGSSVADIYGLNDKVLTLGITPNRADCLGVMGVARDLSAKLGLPLQMPPALDANGKSKDLKSASHIKVSVENTTDCPRFCALYVANVQAIPSPLWLRNRLTAAGMRPINIIVDATNYAMLEFGQPIHAYDLRDIRDKTIHVRNAKPKETLTLLDGKTVALEKDDILICDGKGPIGLAGVMGGANSEVKADTKEIIIEVAGFSSTKIRKTAKRLGLHTEASHRFERGTPAYLADQVAWRVAQIISQGCGAKVASDLVDENAIKTLEGSRIALRLSRTRQILGMPVLTLNQCIDSLKALGFELLDKNDERMVFQVPLFRHDIVREIDLIEEIGRMIGYDQITPALPVMELGGVAESKFISFLEDIRLNVAELGFLETVSFPFVGSKDLDALRLLEDHPYRRLVELVNPLSEDMRFLQPSLLINLLKALEGNERRGEKGARLFEVGRSYLDTLAEGSAAENAYLQHLTQQGLHLSAKAKAEQRYVERNMFAAVIGQPFQQKTWVSEERPADFFDGKRAVEKILHHMGLVDLKFVAVDAASVSFLHPRKSAFVQAGKSILGFVGELHPETALLFGFSAEQAPIVLELNLENVFAEKTQKLPLAATSVGEFPPVVRDLAFVVDEAKTHGDFIDALGKFSGKRNLSDYRLFDVYQGDKMAEGKKSLAYAFKFQSHKRTLNDKEVDLEIELIIKYLGEALGAQLR